MASLPDETTDGLSPSQSDVKDALTTSLTLADSNEQDSGDGKEDARMPHFSGAEVLANSSEKVAGSGECADIADTAETAVGSSRGSVSASSTATGISSGTSTPATVKGVKVRKGGQVPSGKIVETPGDIKEYHGFCFPVALKKDCLDTEEKDQGGKEDDSEEDESDSDEEDGEEDDSDEESSSGEDEDTDAQVDKPSAEKCFTQLQTSAEGLKNKIVNAEMFTDPEEREKWKNRGWRAAQCCGGTLLVLALIFDELD